MAVDTPKFVLDEFIGTALSSTPQDLHPFFESFRTLHTRKSVEFNLMQFPKLILSTDYGTN